MKVDKAIVAIVCIAAIEVAAIIKGLNGTGLSVAVGTIAALGGYIIAKKT